MPPNILIRVGADTAAAARELQNLNGPLSDVQTRGERMSAGLRKAALPAIAVLGGLAIAGKGAAEAAAEDEAGQVRLAKALELTTGATAAQDASVESWISKLSLATGTADDELRPALAKLASATGDVGAAQDQLKLALDISAASGKSLSAVTKALASANDGHAQSLAKLVPGIDAAILKSGDMAKITDALADKVGGSAASAANTAAGRYKIMQVQMGELQESIGTALIPVISALSAVMLKATAFASEHTTAIKLIVGAVAALAAGVLIANVALKAYEAIQIAVKAATAIWTATQWLLNAALTANPIGLVIVAVAGLAAGIAIAYAKSETFRDAVGALWKILGFTNPIAAIIQHFDDLKSAIEAVVGWISRIHFPSPPSWLGKIGGAVGGLFGAGAPTGAAGARLATRTAGAPRSRAALRSLSPLTVGGSGDSITINVFGASDPEGTARSIRRALRGHKRRQGALYSLPDMAEPAT